MSWVEPDAPVERIELDDGSWVDVVRGWVRDPAAAYESLYSNVPWQSSRLFRYDHWVEERRLGAMWRPGLALPDEGLADAHRSLQRRYKVQFPSFGLLQYRDGDDGQAFHRDTDMRYLDDTIIAILTLGAERPWLLRPKTAKHSLAEGRGATHDLSPGGGDLIVMGGKCQADWEHSVPYLKGRSSVGTRISIQWRFARKVGRPFMGAGYRAPLNYSGR